MSEVTMQYDIYAIFEIVRKGCPAIYPGFCEKLKNTLEELQDKRSSPRGLIVRLTNDPKVLSGDTTVVPEGVWFINILDMGDRTAIADIDVHAVMKVFWVLDFNAGTLVDNSHTLESVH